MTKQEILEEFKQFKKAARWKLEILMIKNGAVIDAEAISEDWLSSALDRYAMAVVEASVPESKRMDVGDYGSDSVSLEPWGAQIWNQDNRKLWNICRNTTLKKAREITHSEEK